MPRLSTIVICAFFLACALALAVMPEIGAAMHDRAFPVDVLATGVAV